MPQGDEEASRLEHLAVCVDDEFQDIDKLQSIRSIQHLINKYETLKSKTVGDIKGETYTSLQERPYGLTPSHSSKLLCELFGIVIKVSLH